MPSKKPQSISLLTRFPSYFNFILRFNFAPPYFLHRFFAQFWYFPRFPFLLLHIFFTLRHTVKQTHRHTNIQIRTSGLFLANRWVMALPTSFLPYFANVVGQIQSWRGVLISTPCTLLPQNFAATVLQSPAAPSECPQLRDRGAPAGDTYWCLAFFWICAKTRANSPLSGRGCSQGRQCPPPPRVR